MRSRRHFGKALLLGLVGGCLALGTLGATPTIQYNCGDPTGDEQYLLELINRARSNPTQEGIFITSFNSVPPTSNQIFIATYNFFNVNLATVRSQFTSILQAQPLAMNAKLLTAARGHSADMHTFNYQGHRNPGDPSESNPGFSVSFGLRLSNVGYGVSAATENVYAPVGGAHLPSALYGHVGLNVDWGVSPPDHRKAIMGIHDASFDYSVMREAGVGLVTIPANYSVNGAIYTSEVYITQDLALSSSPNTVFLVGVVYTDTDANGFYTSGEGKGGITVMPDVGTDYAITSSSGGYAIPLLGLPGGTTSITLTFSGGALGTQQLVRTVALNGTKNVKADVVPLIITPQAIPSGNNIMVQFPSVIGQRYRVERTGDFTTWTPVQDNIAGTGLVIQVTHTSGMTLGQQFYRVRVL